MLRLHSHAFYLYSAIVGLAIREALVGAGRHIFIPLPPAAASASAYSTLAPWQIHLEAFRLVLFLFTISCFYFGCGLYFEKVHIHSEALVNPRAGTDRPEETATTGNKKSYGLDFGMGLIHFLIFFAWAIAITDHSRYSWGVSPFLVFLTAIFLYDLVWLVVSARLDSVEEIKLWAWVCAFFWFIGAVVFFGVRAWKNDVVAEEACYFVFYFYLCGDVIELFSGKPFFLKWILKALPSHVAGSLN